MNLQAGDMFQYIGVNMLSDADYVVLVEEDNGESYNYWKMFEVETGDIVVESIDTLLNEEIYRKLA